MKTKFSRVNQEEDEDEKPAVLLKINYNYPQTHGVLVRRILEILYKSINGYYTVDMLRLTLSPDNPTDDTINYILVLLRREGHVSNNWDEPVHGWRITDKGRLFYLKEYCK